MRGAHGLGELEADIMAVLWDNAQLITVRHVLTVLQRTAAPGRILCTDVPGLQ